MEAEARKLREKRVASEIPGAVLCLKARISRSRPSDIELGHVTGTPAEISRIDTALEQLIDAKRRIRTLAEEVGWPAAV